MIEKISERERNLPKSQLIKIFKIAEEDKRVISLGPGEPDFITPKNIRDFTKKKMDEGFTHYTSIGGMKVLKEAIARKLKRENKIDANEDEIVVTTGAKEAILLTYMALIDPGECCLVPDPGYFPYISINLMIGGIPLSVHLKQEEGFEYNIDEIKRLLNEKTRLLVINSPANPTGTVFSKKKLEEIADFVIDNDLIVLSDEAYEKFLYDDAKHISIGSLNGMKKHVVSIYSFSKTYAMTGFRLGYAVGPEEIIRAMTKLKVGTTLSSSSVSQMAGVEALNGNQKSVEIMVKEYARRRKLICKRLDEIQLDCVKPRGAFYAFPNISKFGKSSVNFSEFLLNKAKVLVVPGNEFGRYGKGFVRMSYATSHEKIEEAMDRIEKSLNKL